MIKIVKGDLLTATEQYIAHQCNCISKQSAGLARFLFMEYPYADTYFTRDKTSVPGSIDILGNGLDQRYVINMYSQYYPGTANNKYGNDSTEQRKHYFKECLAKISNIAGIESVAVPFGIGCGLAGGNWDDYLKMLTDFSNNSNIQLVIYQK